MACLPSRDATRPNPAFNYCAGFPHPEIGKLFRRASEKQETLLYLPRSMAKMGVAIGSPIIFMASSLGR